MSSAVGHQPDIPLFGKIERRWLGLLAVILADLVVGAFLAWQIVHLREYPFDSDEALHATRGLALAFDLRRGDFGAFLTDSYRQSVYPPGSSWLEAIAFLLFGAGVATARLYSLASFLGATLVIYAIGLELDERLGWLAGLVAVLLTLAAQSILVHAGLAMLEMPGLLVSLTSLWLYLRAGRSSGRTGYLLVSLLLALTTLIKYPFGLVLLGTIGLAEIAALLEKGADRRPGRLLRRWLLLFGPFALLMVIWFSGQGKIEGFLYYASLQPQTAAWYSLDNLIFYPRAFIQQHAPAPAFAIISLAGVLWSATRWRERPIRLILLYCLLGFLMMTVKESNNRRFIVTIAPAVHLLTGVMLARLAAVLVKPDRPPLALAAGAVTLLLAGVGLLGTIESYRVLPDLLVAEYETDPRSADLTDWIAANTRGQRLYFINPWDQFSTYAMEWHQATTRSDHGHRFGDLFVPDTRLGSFSPERAEELEFQIRFYSTGYVVALQGGLEGQQVWPEYAGWFAGELKPIATRAFPITYYYLDSWLNGARVTQENLDWAKEMNRIDLLVQATIYELQDNLN